MSDRTLIFFSKPCECKISMGQCFITKTNELCWFWWLPSGTTFWPKLYGREIARLLRMAGLSGIVSFKFPAAWSFQISASHNLPTDSQYLRWFLQNGNASKIQSFNSFDLLKSLTLNFSLKHPVILGCIRYCFDSRDLSHQDWCISNNSSTFGPVLCYPFWSNCVNRKSIKRQTVSVSGRFNTLTLLIHNG